MAKFLLCLWITLSLLMAAEVLMAFDESQFRHISLGPSPNRIEPPVDFLESPPVIDGRLDDSLWFLPERQFAFAYVLQNDSVIPASYRLAYGAGFFYVYLEASADHLICRDRAYQNGDGFHLVIAAPRLDGAPTTNSMCWLVLPLTSRRRNGLAASSGITTWTKSSCQPAKTPDLRVGRMTGKSVLSCCCRGPMSTRITPGCPERSDLIYGL